MGREKEWPTAEAFLPERRNLTALQEAVQGCRGCPLYQRATQAVFGEGLVRARLMLVGEQPGDQEDRAGKPFVGPAGRVLDRGLEEAGIDRGDAYVTNIVKHFKWTGGKGDRRYHKQPSLIGPAFRVTRQGGEFVASERAEYVTGTIHPSSILRQTSDRDRRRAMAAFVADLEKVAAVLS